MLRTCNTMWRIESSFFFLLRKLLKFSDLITVRERWEVNAQRRERKGGRGNWSKHTVWSVEAKFICDVRWRFS